MAEKIKKCPMRKIVTSHCKSNYDATRILNAVFKDCILDECAWYHEKLKRCVIGADFYPFIDKDE
jgi:hypothetical protein